MGAMHEISRKRKRGKAGKRKRKTENERGQEGERDTIKPFLGSVEKSVNRPTFMEIFF